MTPPRTRELTDALETLMLKRDLGHSFHFSLLEELSCDHFCPG